MPALASGRCKICLIRPERSRGGLHLRIDDGLDVRAPKLERFDDFLGVIVMLINLDQWVRVRAAGMVQAFLSYRHRHTEPRHPASHGPSQIVVGPVLKVWRLDRRLSLAVA